MFHLLRRRRPRCYIHEPDLERSLRRLGSFIAALALLHIAAMMHWEGLRLGDALWLTATTIVTVGYGDLSAKTDAGRASTIVLMYGGGIFFLGALVTTIAEWRAYMLDRKATGNWDWKAMHQHLLIIGEPSGDGVDHVSRLIDQVRQHEDWVVTPIILLTRGFERIPARLADRGIVHVAGSATDAEALGRTHPEKARMALVFARSETDAEADANVLYTVARLRDVAPSLPIVAELVREDHRQRCIKQIAGVEAIRPMHGYPEMAARAIVSPGAATVIENLFTAHGEECRRYDLPRAWQGNWTDLLVTLATRGIGTAVGCQLVGGNILTNPIGQQVQIQAIYVVVSDAVQAQAPALIREALLGLARP